MADLKKQMFSKQSLPLLTIIGATVADEILPNLLPGLVPPEGAIWRGATIDGSGPLESDWTLGADPNEFEDYYHYPLHIYRSFNNKTNAPLTLEKDWIREGGILWYSL